MGIQGSGKSTFYKERFFNSHLRISLDLLNTRNKEKQFFEKGLELQQRIVIDNTNPSTEDRAKYIKSFKQKKYKVIGFHFNSNVDSCLLRNDSRKGKEKVPKVGVFSTIKRLVPPRYVEGFDQLFEVKIVDGKFNVKEIIK